MDLLPRTRLGRLRLLALTLVPAALLAFAYALVIAMPGASFKGEPPALTALESQTVERLQSTVRVLAGEIGQRNDAHPEGLEAAAAHIERELAALGYDVRRLPFDAYGNSYVNLEARLSGSDSSADPLIVGAHYDSVHGTPGADDNASGTAAVLELAGLLREPSMQRDVVFVFFANEEPPHFQRKSMGSLVYARQLARNGVQVRAMIAVESIGYFRTEEGSQSYPFPFSLFYPTRGDFIAFVGNIRSRALVRRALRTFRDTTELPSEGVAAPAKIPGVGWSDHWSFWQHGWPALMVTDTAPFRNPNYHEPTDTPDTLDYASAARVVLGLARVVAELGG